MFGSARPTLTDDELAAAIAGQLDFNPPTVEKEETAPRTGSAWPILLILLAFLG
jgi:hypothetical protein